MVGDVTAVAPYLVHLASGKTILSHYYKFSQVLWVLMSLEMNLLLPRSS